MVDLPSVCPLDCPDTCSLTVTVEADRIVKIRGSHANPYTAGVLCAKVPAMYPEFVHGPGRLTTPLRFHSGPGREAVEEVDPTNLEDGRITVAHELRKIFLVSDNSAFNRLYDLVGQADLNDRMWRLGLESVRLRHRLSMPLPPEQNRLAPRVEVLLEEEQPLELPEEAGPEPAEVTAQHVPVERVDDDRRP